MGRPHDPLPPTGPPLDRRSGMNHIYDQIVPNPTAAHDLHPFSEPTCRFERVGRVLADEAQNDDRSRGHTWPPDRTSS